jgi:hypothetical protein
MIGGFALMKETGRRNIERSKAVRVKAATRKADPTDSEGLEDES